MILLIFIKQSGLANVRIFLEYVITITNILVKNDWQYVYRKLMKLENQSLLRFVPCY